MSSRLRFLSNGSRGSIGAWRRRRFELEPLEDRLLLAASVEEFPLRSTGGGVVGITTGVNGDPNLYFTSPSTNSIGVYNPKTAGSVSQYPIPTVNANAQNLAVGDSGAGDLVAGSDGNIYFLETAANQIGVFSPTVDKVIAEYPILSSSNAGLQAITSGPDGNIWFTESLQNEIGEFNITTHLFTEFNVPTSLSNPYGITSDSADDAVWFTESNTNNIGELNLQTHVFFEFKLGSSSLNPGNITYNSVNGNVYFVETQTESIGWLNAKNPTTAQSATGLKDTSINDDLTVDSSGNIWATDYSSGYVSLLSVSTGKITTSGYLGYNPEGITLGSDGRLWVGADGDLQPFTTAVVAGTEVTIPGTIIITPGAVVTDSNGNLWFVDSTGNGGFDQIDLLSLTTQLTSTFQFPKPGSVFLINSLALDTQNKQIYYTEAQFGSQNSIIGVINPTTGVATDLATLSTTNADADGITYDPMNGGYLWFTEEGANKIGYVNPGGNVAEINTTPAGETEPDAIVADSSGNLWVSWYGSGTIDRFTPTGSGSWLSKPITLGGGANSNPTGITYGPDGNIWVVEAGHPGLGVSPQVEVINPSTLAIIKSIPISGTGSITSRSEDGTIWITTSTSLVSIATRTYAQTTYTMPATMGGPVSVVADETDHNVYFTAPGTNPSNGSYYPDAVGVITLSTASQPDHLAITTPPPTNVKKGVGFGLVVGVDTSNDVLDGFLNTIDASPHDMLADVDALGGTVTISLGANPTGDTLGGTLTEPVNNGVAVFSGLTLNNPGPGEVLSISYTGFSSISSSPITVALAATKVAVEAQPPANVGAGQPFTVAFEAVDSNGNLDTSYNGPISVTTGVNPTGAILGGTTLLGATNGIATFSTLTLGKPGPGYTIQGSDPNGVLSPISSAAFTVTGGLPASIAAAAGTPQSATVGTAFATALQATVEDQFGNPVSGVSVTFAVPMGVTGGSFRSGSTATVTTDSAGVATAPTLTANTVFGSYTVTAAVTGVSVRASFNLSNTADVASIIAAAAGTPQSAAVGTAFATALKATVKDQYGNPVSGVSVVFAAPTTGVGGNFASGSTTTVTTNSVGVATAPAFTANTVVGSYTVNATVSGVSAAAAFNLSNTAGAASNIVATAGTPQSTAVGTAFATALQATVKDQYGNPVSGVSVTFAAPATGASGGFGGSTTVTTDLSGHASETFTANTVAGRYAVTGSVTSVSTPASFSLSNTAGAASSVAATAGTPQSATINTAFATPFRATVVDQYGNPVSGVNVAFAAPVGGAAGSFSGSATAMAATNSRGVATALTFTANTTIGSYIVTATVPGVSSSASFALTNTVGVPASVTATAGTTQSALTHITFGKALQATVKDQFGDPLSGVSVTFAAPSSGASGSFASSPTITTNASGVATAPAFTANASLGTYTVIATVVGVAAPASFSLTNNGHPVNDFAGNGVAAPSLFRRTGPYTAAWFVQGVSPLVNRSFGAGGLDVPLTGDFDGDGKADLALYRPSTAQWFVEESGSGYAAKLLTTFGEAKVDIPVPGDYTGNGITVPAVYRPTTGQWFIQGHSGTITFTTYKAGDIPVAGNYDGTGQDEPAIYRPSTGQWIIDGPKGAYTISFGGPNDIPAPGDFDALTTGNTAVEPAVWRPSTSQFFIYDAMTGKGRMIQFAKGDIPAPGDYDGIGEMEAAVYRPSTGQWLVEGPKDKSPRVFTAFGGPADVPTVAPYPYRALKSGGGLISAFSVGDPVGVELGATIRAYSPGAPARRGLTTPSESSVRPLTRSLPTQTKVQTQTDAAHSLVNRDLGNKPIRSLFPGSIKRSILGRLVHA